MKKETLSSLVCPACNEPLIISEAVEMQYQDTDELREGLLGCSACDAWYPVLCGVAVVVPQVASWLRSNYFHVIEGTSNAGGVGQELSRFLDDQGWRYSSSPASNYYELPRWINIFASTHYDPVPAGSDDDSRLGQLIASETSVFDWVLESLGRHLDRKNLQALDVGTNVGGMALRLASIAESVTGIDTAFNPVLTARKVQCGKPVPQRQVRRYEDGLRYKDIDIGEVPDNTEFLVASLFDLPMSKTWDVITALNVIDVVPDPGLFLDALIGRLNQHGLLVLTSPYSWGSDDVPIDNWLMSEGQTSDETLRKALESRQVTIVDEADYIPWVLREHQRWYRVFHNHCVVVRKEN